MTDDAQPADRPFEGATLPHPETKHVRRGVFVIRMAQTGASEDVAVVRRLSVGTAEGNGLVVGDRTVSRVHAELVPSDEGLWVRDLGSRNGTFIDGVRIKEAEWRPGATLRVGALRLTLGPSPVAVRVEVWPHDTFGPLVGSSAVMRELFATLSRVAPTTSSVLITGETGTGKELVARALHEASPRASGPYGIVDCASLPESLVESELFGHARGAFTGAGDARVGAIEATDGGTLLLDEIGDLPLGMQSRLLRFLESRTVRRVGETNHRPVDVRVLAATNRDLLSMVSTGQFREDLYFRLAVVPVAVPPLRHRIEDIPFLARRFASSLGAEGLGEPILDELAKRPFQGNVRELRNLVERMAVLGAERALAMEAGVALAPRACERPADTAALDGTIDFGLPFKAFREVWIEQGERTYLSQLIARHAGDMVAALEAAGIDRTYLYRLKRKYRL